MDLKGKFFKVYNNLPLGLREEVVLVLNNEPITWKVARIEIENDTQLSKEILNDLQRLEII